MSNLRKAHVTCHLGKTHVTSVTRAVSSNGECYMYYRLNHAKLCVIVLFQPMKSEVFLSWVSFSLSWVLFYIPLS